MSELATDNPWASDLPRCRYVVSPRIDGKVDRSGKVVCCGKLASHVFGSYPICAGHVFDAQVSEPKADDPTPITPYVGMPATISYLTDRTPATVVYVSKGLGKIIVMENEYKRTDTNGMSDSQEYEILGVTDREHIFFRNRRGGYGGRGKRLVLGVQEAYFDYSY